MKQYQDINAVGFGFEFPSYSYICIGTHTHHIYLCIYKHIATQTRTYKTYKFTNTRTYLYIYCKLFSKNCLEKANQLDFPLQIIFCTYTVYFSTHTSQYVNMTPCILCTAPPACRAACVCASWCCTPPPAAVARAKEAGMHHSRNY
jgi:hypothetical protein